MAGRALKTIDSGTEDYRLDHGLSRYHSSSLSIAHGSPRPQHHALLVEGEFVASTLLTCHTDMHMCCVFWLPIATLNGLKPFTAYITACLDIYRAHDTKSY